MAEIEENEVKPIIIELGGLIINDFNLNKRRNHLNTASFSLQDFTSSFREDPSLYLNGNFIKAEVEFPMSRLHEKQIPENHNFLNHSWKITLEEVLPYEERKKQIRLTDSEATDVKKAIAMAIQSLDLNPYTADIMLPERLEKVLALIEGQV